MDNWITVIEAARMLDVSPRRVLRFIEGKRIQAQKLHPRMWMIERASVENMVRVRMAKGLQGEMPGELRRDAC